MRLGLNQTRDARVVPASEKRGPDKGFTATIWNRSKSLSLFSLCGYEKLLTGASTPTSVVAPLDDVTAPQWPGAVIEHHGLAVLASEPLLLHALLKHSRLERLHLP